MARPRRIKTQQAIEAAQKAVADIIAGAEQKIEEMGERTPGKVVNGVKTPWTRADMERFERIVFTPAHTVKVTWNGILYQMIESVEMMVPEPVYYVYKDAYDRMRNVGKSMPSSGFPMTVTHGAGGLEPEVAVSR